MHHLFSKAYCKEKGIYQIIYSNKTIAYFARLTRLQAAHAALAAGARRKQLAHSVASTASSSGSSGKRSHKSMVPTTSTQVTPEPKVVCNGEPPAVEPRALAFGNPGGEGGV